MRIQVVPVDPYDATLSLLIPGLTQRLLETAAKVMPEGDPEKVTRSVLLALYAKDPKLKVLAVVKDGKSLVGHAVGSLLTDEAHVWVLVSQLRADGNVGDALKQIIAQYDEWGRRYGARHMVLVTGPGEKGWEDELAFKTVRRNVLREIGAPARSQQAAPAAVTVPVEEPAPA